MANPTSNDLPALIPQKLAPQPRRLANAQGIIKKRVFKKRNRKIATCTNCRSRKVGCNKGQPCSHCKTKDLQCIYIEDPSELDKAPTRVVKKRNRRVKVCMNCRDRKVPCNRGTPSCRACEDASLDCTYQTLSRAHIAQHDKDQASTGSVANNNDLQQGIDKETNSAARKPSPVLDIADGRQGRPSGVHEYSASQNYSYATSQIQPQHRHQHSRVPLNGLPEPRYNYQDHTAYGNSGGGTQVRQFKCNDRDESQMSIRTGADIYTRQTYPPVMDPRSYVQRHVPYSHSLSPFSARAPIYPQPTLNYQQPLYTPQHFYHDPTFRSQEPPSAAPGPQEIDKQPKLEHKFLEPANTEPYEYGPLNNLHVGAINGLPFQPSTVPHSPRLGEGSTLQKA